MKLALIGAGNVGGALARRLVALGHQVTVLSRDPASPKLQPLLQASPGLTARTLAEGVGDADVVLLAVPFAAAASTLQALGELGGRIVVDCTNPVGPGLQHGLASREAGTEQLQRAAPSARLVKAFTVYGWENFADSSFPGHGDLRPVMPIAGDDVDARRVVAGLCEQLGFAPLDCGPAAAALHLEHMTLLWIQLARVGGLGPRWTWARLTR